MLGQLSSNVQANIERVQNDRQIQQRTGIWRMEIDRQQTVFLALAPTSQYACNFIYVFSLHTTNTGETTTTFHKYQNSLRFILINILSGSEKLDYFLNWCSKENWRSASLIMLLSFSCKNLKLIGYERISIVHIYIFLNVFLYYNIYIMIIFI